MKKLLVAAGIAAIALSSLVYAVARNRIEPLPASGVDCNIKGGWQFVANWEPLVDGNQRPDPTTKKYPTLLVSGKPWPTYYVELKPAPSSRGSCSLPNGGISQVIDCKGATKCSVLVTCSITALAQVNVVGYGAGHDSYPVRTALPKTKPDCK